MQSQLEHPAVKAVGYIAGDIVHIGQDYNSLVGSYSAYQNWTSSWANHYLEEGHLERLRAINEGYLEKIINYEEAYVAQFRSIENRYVSARRVAERRTGFNSLRTENVVESDGSQADIAAENSMPRIFLGTGYLMGLVPSNARLGDVIIRFWNCNAAVVMRPVDTTTITTEFTLVGRVDIAESSWNKDNPWDFAKTTSKALRQSNPLQGSTTDSQLPGMVQVDLNMKTLQMITSRATTWT